MDDKDTVNSEEFDKKKSGGKGKLKQDDNGKAKDGNGKRKKKKKEKKLRSGGGKKNKSDKKNHSGKRDEADGKKMADDVAKKAKPKKVKAKRLGGKKDEEGGKNKLYKNRQTEGTVRRQNEFGDVSTKASLLYSQLKPLIRYIGDRFMFFHIQSLFVAIKNCDTLSDKGRKVLSKGLQSEEGRKLLTSFSFNRNYSLLSLLHIIPSIDPENGILTLRDFQGSSSITYPDKTPTVVITYVLVRFDFDGIGCVVSRGEEYVAYKNDASVRDIVMQAEVPEGKGIVIGMLYVGVCDIWRGEFNWSYNRMNVLAVVGVWA